MSYASRNKEENRNRVTRNGFLGRLASYLVVSFTVGAISFVGGKFYGESNTLKETPISFESILTDEYDLNGDGVPDVFSQVRIGLGSSLTRIVAGVLLSKKIEKEIIYQEEKLNFGSKRYNHIVGELERQRAKKLQFPRDSNTHGKEL